MADANTLLLLHFNGTDGSTVITDDGSTGHSPVAVADAQIDTAHSKFEGASGLFDGTDDEVNIPDHANWDLGIGATSPFTYEMWVRFDDVSASRGLISQYFSTSRYWGLEWIQSTSRLFFKSVWTSTRIQMSATWSPSVDTWYHVAVVRDTAGSLYLFVDGVELTLIDNSNGTMSGSVTADLKIGFFERNLSRMSGHIDEVRFSDIARWVAGFTPPAVEYGDVTNDVSITFPVLWMMNPHVIELPKFQVSGAGGATGNINLPMLSVQALGGASSVINLPIITISSTGSPGNVGEMTLPIFTVSAGASGPGVSITFPIFIVSTSVMNSGVSVTLPIFTVLGEEKNRATSSIALPKFVTNTVAQQGHVESFFITLPMLTLNAFTGHKVALTLPSLSLATSGTNGYRATFDQSLPRMTINVKAIQNGFATFDITLPRFTLSNNCLTGIVSVSGSNRTLPQFTLNAHAFRGENGDGAISLPIFTLVTNAPANPSGEFTQSLFSLTLNAFADVHTNRII